MTLMNTSKEDVPMAYKHTKRCHMLSGKMQIKTRRHHYTNVQNLEHRQHQMLSRMWNNRNSHSLLAGTQNYTATLKGSSVVTSQN